LCRLGQLEKTASVSPFVGIDTNCCGQPILCQHWAPGDSHNHRCARQDDLNLQTNSLRSRQGSRHIPSRSLKCSGGAGSTSRSRIRAPWSAAQRRPSAKARNSRRSRRSCGNGDDCLQHDSDDEHRRAGCETQQTEYLDDDLPASAPVRREVCRAVEGKDELHGQHRPERATLDRLQGPRVRFATDGTA
jgi:hypothetical protein